MRLNVNNPSFLLRLVYYFFRECLPCCTFLSSSKSIIRLLKEKTMARMSLFLSLSFILLFTLECSSSVVHPPLPKAATYELKKGSLSVKLTNWGASIISLVVPDKYGKLADVALGYDSIKEYQNDTSYLGATVGRVANRIKGAQFSLNGTHYKLVANEGNNTLHGGSKGFSDVVWRVSQYNPNSAFPSITFSYFSHDGEEGFPGDLKVTVTYRLHDSNELSIVMHALAYNKPTPVNLVDHTYWNLGGQNSGKILSENIQIFASHYTPVDQQLIPTGKIASVKGTPYDFLKPRSVGSRIKKLANGYDINYVLDGDSHGRTLKKAAIVHDKKSGRVMELLTNAPGMQFYTSNFLKDVKGKNGYIYQPHDALCLETQGFPDAVNHPNFPSQIVSPGKPYKHLMYFKFSTAN